jgi:Tat protein secretion system quality control protein TatD with DNase activity
VIEKIAELKGLDPENCAEILRKNARDVYRIGEA